MVPISPFAVLLFSTIPIKLMTPVAAALTSLFNKIPRRHSLENVKDINSILAGYEDLLITIEGINPYYEKIIPVFFEELDTIRSIVKKATDSKASKKSKDDFFDEASGALKDSLQALIEVYGDGTTSGQDILK